MRLVVHCAGAIKDELLRDVTQLPWRLTAVKIGGTLNLLRCFPTATFIVLVLECSARRGRADDVRSGQCFYG